MRKQLGENLFWAEEDGSEDKIKSSAPCVKSQTKGLRGGRELKEGHLRGVWRPSPGRSLPDNGQ